MLTIAICTLYAIRKDTKVDEAILVVAFVMDIIIVGTIAITVTSILA